MSLTVLNVGYPLAAVGPHAVGGAEQILSLLDRALVAAGCRSIVVARADSQCAGTLVPIPPLKEMLDHHLQPAAQAQCRRAIETVLAQTSVDVVHLHGLDFHAYLPPAGPPTLVTLHLPLPWYAPEAFRVGRPRTYLHCVSASQQQLRPDGVELLPPIENGVPLDALSACHGKRRYVIALGRICWEKGFHIALDAAAQARIPILLGGMVFPYAAHERYFREQIVPRLTRTRRFLGPLGMSRKRRLLTAAQALLAPSLVPETGSLVAMEALACGTPVIAFRTGALADVVEHGVTGFLVNSLEEMSEAIHAAAALDPAMCRSAARRRFSERQMIDQYLVRYRLLARDVVPARPREEEGSYAA